MQIVWSDHDGNRIEDLLGVMLCRRFPHANRIRPDQGDGGIDVMVPVGDGLYDIYQVKGFTASLTDSQKTQVKKSLKRISENPHVKVRDWYLAVPVNPTPTQAFTWFDSVTEDYDFACHWFGLDQCVGLAAEYPEVTRYYLGDGPHELEQALANLRAITPLALSGEVPGQLVAISDLTAPFSAAHAQVNRADPHYRYDFMITKHFPFDLDTPPPAQPDGLDMAVAASAQVADNIIVTTMIFPRYDEAQLDRPLVGKFAIPVDEVGEPLDGAAAKFLEFGSSGQFVVNDLALDLPGGLSASAVEGLVKVGPAHHPGAEPWVLRLVPVDGSGKRMGEAICLMQPVTKVYGAKAGVLARGVSERGVFGIEMPMHPELGTISLRFALNSLVGREPADIAREMWFLHNLASAAEVRIGPRNGPLSSSGLTLQGQDLSMFEDRLLYLIDDLALIQREVCGSLRVPDFDEGIDAQDVTNIRISAALLRGVTVRTTYTAQQFTLPTDAAQKLRGNMLGVPVRIEINGSRQHEIAGHKVVVEPIAMGLESATISAVDDLQDGFLAVPAQSDKMLIRVISEIEFSQRGPVPMG